MHLKRCPWKIKRVSISHQEMEILTDYLESLNLGFDSMLEIGCGSSSWYMSQYGFNKYVAVEELDHVIDLTKEHVPDIDIVKRWGDIPKQQYQYIFIDSHVGGDARGNERHKPLIYIMENGLASDDAILIAHDVWGNQIDVDPATIDVPQSWKEALRKYGWDTIKSIKDGKNFGVFQRQGVRK